MSCGGWGGGGGATDVGPFAPAGGLSLPVTRASGKVSSMLLFTRWKAASYSVGARRGFDDQLKLRCSWQYSIDTEMLELLSMVWQGRWVRSTTTEAGRRGSVPAVVSVGKNEECLVENSFFQIFAHSVWSWT